MAKWVVGFIVVEFLFLLAWVVGVDRNRERREQEKEQGKKWLERRRELAGGGQDDGGHYRSILVAELEATAEVLSVGIERLKTAPDVSLAGLREFRDRLAAQVYVMRNCTMQNIPMTSSNWEPMPPILQNGSSEAPR